MQLVYQVLSWQTISGHCLCNWGSSVESLQGITDAFHENDMEKAQTLVTLLRYVTRIQTAVLEKL